MTRRLLFALVIGFFGVPASLRADAISLAFLMPAAGNKVQGKGTFSVDPNRKFKKIEMVVRNAQNQVVSRTAGVVLMGTTEWGSISNQLNNGHYTVQAELTTTDLQGENQMTTPSNIMPWSQ